jgi:hypothetical protein
MQQVKDSPDVETDQPVSRQIEAHVYNYYGWDPYWGSSLSPMSNAIAMPFVAPLHLSEARPHNPGSADAQPNEGDPHLRSIAAVTGYDIHATDGGIVHVEDFLVDDADWGHPLHHRRHRELVARREGLDLAPPTVVMAASTRL